MIYDPRRTNVERCVDIAGSGLLNATATNFTIEPGTQWTSVLELMEWLERTGQAYDQVPFYQIGADASPPDMSASGTFYEFHLYQKSRDDRLNWECLESAVYDDMRSDVCPEEAGRIASYRNEEFLLLAMPGAQIGQQIVLRFSYGFGRQRTDQIVTLRYVDPQNAIYFAAKEQYVS